MSALWAEAGLSELAAAIDRLALDALRRELACFPKPGLVSHHDRGSHRDMDAATFERSIAALEGYFAAMAAAGAAGAGFAALNALGREAERRMLAATGGRNTHRGAVFSLGLLAAGIAAAAAAGRGSATAACLWVAAAWGRDIRAAERRPAVLTHGAAVRARYGVAGARHEAAAGFPTVQGGLAAYRRARRAGADANAAGVQALFAIMAVLPDNNLLHRGGRAGLAFAQAEARAFLATGGILAACGPRRALAVHRRFQAAGLSPGGAADLLAAALFLDAWEEVEGRVWAWR